MLKKLILTTLALLTVFNFFACSLPTGEKGSLVITLPGASNTGARAIKLPEENRDYYLDRMSYTLTFTGPGETITLDGVSGRTITVYLEPGAWTIDVEAVFMHRSDDDIDGRPKPRKAGKASETVTIIAGRQNTVNIPVEVLPELAVVRGKVQREWASNIDRFGFLFIEANDSPDYEFVNGIIGYQWYINDENENTGGILLESKTEKQLIPDISNINERQYYYCVVEYEFHSTDGDSELHTIPTEPAVVYRNFTAENLQDWIDSVEQGEWEDIMLPFEEESLNNHQYIYNFDQTIEINKSKTIELRLPSIDDNNTEMIIKRADSFTDALFIVNNGMLYLDFVHYLILDGNKDAFNVSTEPLIKVDEGKLVLGNNVVLRNNSAEWGGGVHILKGELIMQGNATVYDNTASRGGGGVHLQNSSFTMQGNSEIYGNTVTDYNESGGGVYVHDSDFFMQDNANISGNTATYGSGVFIHNTGTFTMSGGVRVDTNNEVYLHPGQVITVGGDLTAYIVAMIRPNTYENGRPVLGGDFALEENYSKFTVKDENNGNQWFIDSGGRLYR